MGGSPGVGGRFETRQGLVLWRPETGPTPRPDLHLLVTTRAGGNSVGPYSSLNLSLSTGDAPEAVAANRERLRSTLGLDAFHVLRQVHAADVVRCTPGAEPAPADGQWTDRRGEALVIGVADCAPVFVWDVRDRRVALVHAGWRGTAAGVLQSGVTALRQAGSRASDLRVAIGPCIGPCCYEVGDDVAARLPGAIRQNAAGKRVLDLRAANAAQAVQAGIDPAHVLDAPPCTSCEAQRFYSHRRDGNRTGRMWALAWFG